MALAAALVLPGCQDDPPQSCGPSQAAFSVTLKTSDGPLPEDTLLIVSHGAGKVEFDLDGDCLVSDVMYCTPHNRACDDPQDAADWDGSAGPPPVDELVCELWTDGAARVTVTASGYAKLEQVLEAKSNGSCIETRDVELMLKRADGGR